ncbi:SymE family type I addiction module toxin [Pectobacterium odoriferum]|uniref:SymE family type I addiction module toxin n=1 Tax=Pectobacterium odoriferum TaxID=78398 RepID=UPI001FCAA1B9|nr:SymE family type I addiction module toxin [Pectobacterium odoriferum]
MKDDAGTGDELAQAGFTAEAMFRISLYRNGLILTRLDEDTDIAALMAELGGNETEGADWVSDNGELTLAGDWLTLSGLLGQPLSIDVLPGKIVIRAEVGNMLA